MKTKKRINLCLTSKDLKILEEIKKRLQSNYPDIYRHALISLYDRVTQKKDK